MIQPNICYLVTSIQSIISCSNFTDLRAKSQRNILERGRLGSAKEVFHMAESNICDFITAIQKFVFRNVLISIFY